jgi:Calcium binding
MRESRVKPARERRIAYEIVIDAYTREERAMGWYYYLEGRLSFPFRARCIAIWSVSPLKKGEKVEAVAMAREEDCLAEMFVLVAFAGRRVGVPLAQLRIVKADRDTREAVENWHYWLSHGYSF